MYSTNERPHRVLALVENLTQPSTMPPRKHVKIQEIQPRGKNHTCYHYLKKAGNL